VESHGTAQSLPGFMHEHAPIIASRHPETIRTSPNPETV